MGEVTEEVKCPLCGRFSRVFWSNWPSCLAYQNHSDSDNPNGLCANSFLSVPRDAVVENDETVEEFFFQNLPWSR
ncbi:MAG: hypothetical protein JNN11_05360 [Candidatus Doudnabacteria bacterium]|nr:hypothetical protein [Candidatus Doudnabacteria bacterium]